MCGRNPRQRYQVGLDGKEAKSGEMPRKPPTPLESKGLAMELLSGKKQKGNLRRSFEGIALTLRFVFTFYTVAVFYGGKGVVVGMLTVLGNV